MYAGLASLSEGCPPVEGRLHTCYSPVRQSPAGSASTPPAALRLACVKPAASVHPEPGSNSPLLVYIVFYNIPSNCSIGPGFLLNCILTGLISYMSLYSKQLSLLVLMASCQCSHAVPAALPPSLPCGFRRCRSRNAIAKLQHFPALCKSFLKFFS